LLGHHSDLPDTLGHDFIAKCVFFTDLSRYGAKGDEVSSRTDLGKVTLAAGNANDFVGVNTLAHPIDECLRDRHGIEAACTFAEVVDQG